MQNKRKNIRLKGWDYSAEGCYFLTICCKGKKPFFGYIVDHRMHLSKIGSIASQFWKEIPNHFPHVRLDEFVIMPNHLHGIIILDYSLVGSRHGVTLLSQNGGEVGTCHGTSLQGTHEESKHISVDSHNAMLMHSNQKGSISLIINQFKSSVKRWCNKNDFENFAWQSRFYDHIIRDEYSMEKIQDYIIKNPYDWEKDELFV